MSSMLNFTEHVFLKRFFFSKNQKGFLCVLKRATDFKSQRPRDSFLYVKYVSSCFPQTMVYKKKVGYFLQRGLKILEAFPFLGLWILK